MMQNMTINLPSFTTHFTTTNHKNTTLYHHNLAKTPAKTPLHHAGKKKGKSTEKISR
jgi:hypothetical protein